MAMANMNLIGAFVKKLCPVQALACGGGGDATKNIIADIIIVRTMKCLLTRYKNH